MYKPSFRTVIDIFYETAHRLISRAEILNDHAFVTAIVKMQQKLFLDSQLFKTMQQTFI